METRRVSREFDELRSLRMETIQDADVGGGGGGENVAAFWRFRGLNGSSWLLQSSLGAAAGAGSLPSPCLRGACPLIFDLSIIVWRILSMWKYSATSDENRRRLHRRKSTAHHLGCYCRLWI